MSKRIHVLAMATLAMQLSATGCGNSQTLTVDTSDGVTIHGECFFADLDANAPLILLFHQARSNGRGEYGDAIVPWLNEAGFRAIAWDQRSGGELYGSTNRTVAGLSEGTATGYCDASPDLQAALDHVIGSGLADKVIAWGSSYSAALVFKLAADNPQTVQGIVACSPAAGGPLESCGARAFVDDIDAPMLVLRPASEMQHQSSVEQRDILVGAGADFRVVEHGVHGSSMLVDSRTGSDMSQARAGVLAWLQAVTAAAD